MFTTLEKVGLVCITVVGFQFVRTVLRIFFHTKIGPTMRMRVNWYQMGQWAVITGATDGIGKAFANALAERGLDIVLISRSMEKLESVAAEIEFDHGVHTKVIQADFTDSSPEAYHEIEKGLYGMKIGVLINNVGISYPHPEYFLDLPHGDKIYANIISCNIISVTNMTKMLLPLMVQRGRGVVINISSTAAIIPSPLLTVYAASKAYVEKFSRDLSSEYESQGITVQCLMPGYVVTKMSKMKQTTWLAPSPETYVKSAIISAGVRQTTTGYYPHSLLVYIVRMLESITPSFAVWVIMHTMEDIRQRAISRYVR